MQFQIDVTQTADQKWVATLPALPGIAARAETRAEAIAAIQPVVLAELAERIKSGKGSIDPLTVSFTAKEFDLGVLLVHGIGTQPLGDALMNWGDVLLKTIPLATREWVDVIAGPAESGVSGACQAEASITLRFDGRDGRQQSERWLLSEGWWADAFLAPSYAELVSWSVTAAPWALAFHAANRHWSSKGEEPPGPTDDRARRATGRVAKKIMAGIITVFNLLGLLLLAPVFTLVVGLMLIGGLLPIPGLRNAIRGAQGALTTTVGDCLAFVESPIRASLIRTRVLSALERLQHRCNRTIVIAHSQGAAIVLDALGGIHGASDSKGAEEANSSPLGPMPDTLLTFGAGTNQLSSLRALSVGWPYSRAFPAVAIGSLLAAALLAFWLVMDILSAVTTVEKALICSGIFIVGAGLVALIGWVIWRRLSSSSHARTKDQVANIVGSWIAVLFIAALVGVAALANAADLPLGRVCTIALLLSTTLASVGALLSPDLKKAVTRVRKPARLKHWVDIFASADPVPHGPTRTSNDKEVVSIPIHNLGSMTADHTSYWENLDGFVLEVVHRCAETADSAWQERLPSDLKPSRLLSKKRVKCLSVARAIMTIAWVMGGFFAAIKVEHLVPLPFNVPTWLPPFASTVARIIVLATAVAFAMKLSSKALEFVWKFWSRREQNLALHHKPRGPFPYWTFALMGVLVWPIAVAAWLMGITPAGAFAGTEPFTHDWVDILVKTLLATFVAPGLAKWYLGYDDDDTGAKAKTKATAKAIT